MAWQETIDTLIVETPEGYKIEKYEGQNLDEYPHVAEMRHKELATAHMMKYFFMEGITISDIMNYLNSNGMEL